MSFLDISSKKFFSLFIHTIQCDYDMSSENSKKFRLSKDVFEQMKRSDVDIYRDAVVASRLRRNIYSVLGNRMDILKEFYDVAIRSMNIERVKTLEFEDDFYWEDIDGGLAKLLLLFKKLIHYIVSVRQKFRRGREKDIHYTVSAVSNGDG